MMGMDFKLRLAEARDLVETFESNRDFLREALNTEGIWPWYVEHANKLLELYEGFHLNPASTQVDPTALDRAYSAYVEHYDQRK